MKELVEKLREKNKTISTMESCTGGGVVNAITNIEGASEVLCFSAVTYCNEFKIKMGVKKEIIDTFSVYSMETAREMSKSISLFTDSDYGVGITGKLNRGDKFNLIGNDNVVYISIYIKESNQYIEKIIEVDKKSRKENKEIVIETIRKLLMNIL